MSDELQGDLFFYPAGHVPGEGHFDDQLNLPFSAARPCEPVRSVIKRNGREEAFDRTKIAGAILKAAATVQGAADEALATSLAAAVSIYLSKRVIGTPPSVDQIHDAVERVLIHMGQAETALAYARYRDRRARIRRLRQGDLRQVLGELEEARAGREALAGREDSALVVRTREGERTSWDRERIVAALVREAELEEPLARMVALEVEMQIERAHMTTLTVSLVRELVDAKLVEHGLWEHRERYRRLGVSLYDTEQILRGRAGDIAGDAEAAAVSPPATDRVLARAVKREYALAQVFSPTVAEAHLRGELHLHHLGLADRLHSATLGLGHLARHGLSLPDVPAFAGPARHASTLLAHLLKLSATMQGYIAEPLTWDAVNVYFAPYLHEFSREALAQFAQGFVYEFAYRAHLRTGPMQQAEISLPWNVPAGLARQEAVGPGGVGDGKAYAGYEHTAQQWAWAIFDVLSAGGPGRIAFPAPMPVLPMDAAFMKAPGRSAYLRHAARVTAGRHNVVYAFERAGAAAPLTASFLQVTLNLPRAAYAAGKLNHFFEGLDRLARLAVQAVNDKRAFLEGLLVGNGHGPLSLLARMRGGEPLVDVPAAGGSIAVEGLNECVQYLLNSEMHQSDEAAALGARILAYLAERCGALGEAARLPLVLTHSQDPEAGRRFAALDMQAFPRSAATTVKTVDASLEMRYTPGIHLNPAHRLNPFEAVRRAGMLHACVAPGVCAEVRLPETDPEPEAIADFVLKAYEESQARRIRFV
jgi:ribonucleoside-triphosphate reductase